MILTARQSQILEEDSAQALSQMINTSHLNNRRIVITGGFGMLGGWLTYELIRMREVLGSGPEHITVVTGDHRRHDPIWIDRSEAVQIMHLTDVTPQGLPEADLYFHLASPASASSFLADPGALTRLNVQLTQALLEKCAASQGRGTVVFASSSEVYGLAQGTIKEDRVGEVPLGDGRWIYAEAKRLGELLCRSYLDRRDVGSVILRPFHSFGPGLRHDDTRVFGEFTARLVNNLPLLVRGDSATTRSFAYAAEVASAFLVASGPTCRGEVLNVGSPEAVSIGELALTLTRDYYGPSSQVIFERDARSERNPVTSSTPDISKLHALGWSPAIDAVTAFHRTVDFMRESRQ